MDKTKGTDQTAQATCEPMTTAKAAIKTGENPQSNIESPKAPPKRVVLIQTAGLAEYEQRQREREARERYARQNAQVRDLENGTGHWYNPYTQQPKFF